MTWYRYEWSDLVTDSFRETVAGAAGVAAESVPVAPCARILRAVGGLPFTERDLTDGERTEVANRLFHEAVLHLLAVLRGQRTMEPGYVVEEAPAAPYELEIRAVDRVPLNSADAHALSRLPHVGEGIGRNIVRERQLAGRLKSLDDLDARVSGVGPTTVEAVRHAVCFDETVDLVTRAAAATGDLAGDFRSLLALLPDTTPEERVAKAIDALATECGGDPHPSSRGLVVRETLAPLAPPATVANGTGVLFGTEYFYEMPRLFEAATHRIDVAMFHIAFPDEDHPTRQLLDALAAAHERGVTVRVLMDQDRPTDVYNSTVINTPAKEYLEARGVACRFDAEDVLLHSKYVLLDSDIAVVGSHNWSAGSYFQVDDLSLLIWSEELTATMRVRFDGQWDEAQ